MEEETESIMETDRNATLYDVYKDILSDNELWNSTRNKDIEHNFPDVLSSPYSYNFMMAILFYEQQFHSLALSLNDFRGKIPEERFSHTVSLYLFGISVAEVVGFEHFKLSPWDKNSNRNFLHHWAGACLFHDIGYALEEDPTSFGLKGCATIDILKEKFNITFDLTEKENTDLIIKYYSYRSQTMCKIDHGIVGAMLLYDRLMKRDESMQKISDSGCLMFSEKKLYGPEYRADIENYAIDIARHNMWFADEKHIDVYKTYGLDELIPQLDNSHRISFSESPMLFLLCLLDTVEPIKINSDRSKTPEDVLKESSVSIEKRRDQVRLQFGNETMWKKAKSCEDWLDIKVNGDSEIEFSCHGA